jgi:gamma-glutamylaminecyclotransferase
MAGTLIFVYGTLKRGGRSHSFLAGQEFVGAVQTLPYYRLYDCGPYPCLVEDRSHGVAVQGEVWRVDEATLQRLDAYEGVPELYQRRTIELSGGTSPVLAYYYQGDVSANADCGACWSS